MASETILQFTTKQKRLLDLELHADQTDPSEISTDRDGGGFFLRNVQVIDTSVGLYGRTVISFGPNHTSSTANTNGYSNGESGIISKSTPLLAAHRLTVGDEIEILPKNTVKGKSPRASGVVCTVDDYSISIALSEKKRQPTSFNTKSSKKKDAVQFVNSCEEDDEDLLGTGPYTLIPRSGVEVHKKMVMALDELEKHGVDHPIAGEVISAAFGASKHVQSGSILHGDDGMTKERIEELERECHLELTKLDYSQKEAVVFALNSKCPISLIHGPPGTGKTTTVAELIRCAVNIKKWKVLVTAPSNVAVDNVLERIMSLETEATEKKTSRKHKKSNSRIKAVRLGHPARIQQSIQKYSLESQVQSSDGTELVRDCRRELAGHLRTLSDPKSRPTDKRHAYGEMKSLRKEIRSREEKVVGEIVKRADVVLATNVGAAGSVFRRLVDGKGEFAGFDLVIIDEAAQALEASCWISLLRGKRAVLAGDHCQLPPTIKCSNREVQTELGKTLFERLMNSYDSKSNSVASKPSKMLEVQYRMHEDIANWASCAMYHGKLVSHESVKYRKLSSLPQVKEICSEPPREDNTLLQNITLTLIDTTGCEFNEMTTDAGSRYNEGEAELVVSHVKSLLALGLRAEDIAVITPYNGQVELLRKRLLPEEPKLEIRSVDGFQGGEREAVVLSLVRSSERGGKDGIGFLRDERRLNVAVTRAKRHCALICDCETVSQNKFIKDLVEWMEQKGDYRSAAELVPSSESLPSMPISDSGSNKKSKQSKPIMANHDQNNKPQSELIPSKSDVESTTVLNSEGRSDKQDPLKEGARRRALMNSIAAFSETKEKGEQLLLKDLSDFDLVVARELASQLELGCDENGKDRNELMLTIVKKHSNNVKTPETESAAQEINTTNFSQLAIDDDESTDDDAEVSSGLAQNDLLKDLALERQKRQAVQQQAQSNLQTNTAKSKKTKKKKKGQKLGGEKKQTKEPNTDDDLSNLDDMAFLDVQIEKVQTSHGRNIDAKGKGYKSIINGVLLTKHDRHEPKRSNTAAANHLKAKIKAKSDDRQAKKKEKGNK